jgi:hypothetical protein
MPDTDSKKPAAKASPARPRRITVPRAPKPGDITYKPGDRADAWWVTIHRTTRDKTFWCTDAELDAIVATAPKRKRRAA